MSEQREQAVTDAFVSIANSLVDGADILELLTGLTSDCARLLDIASAGLVLADPRGILHVAVASSERTRDLEIFQVQRDEGPCRDCYHTGAPVSVPDLAATTSRWPQFAAAARSAGFASVHALPMRLRDKVLGALGLFGTEVGALNSDDLRLAQALAHVASVALVTERAATDLTTINEQLQTALTSRVVIEQAKGLLSQLGGLDMEQAFGALRQYSRDHNLRLSDLARSVAARETPARAVLEHAEARSSRSQRPDSSQ